MSQAVSTKSVIGHGTDSQDDPAVRIGKLEDALDHISRTAQNSRHYPRRLAWISERAESAIRGDDAWKSVTLPKGASTELERVKYRNIALRESVAALVEGMSYLLEQTVDQDLAQGIELTEGEAEAREAALRLIELNGGQS